MLLGCAAGRCPATTMLGLSLYQTHATDLEKPQIRRSRRWFGRPSHRRHSFAASTPAAPAPCCTVSASQFPIEPAEPGAPIPRLPSLAAFERRPRCAWRGRVGRHPKPVTVGDPVEQGMVESFARPGGNITGLTLMAPEIGGKKLELLKEVVPRAMRVAVLGQEENAFSALDFKNLQAPALTMGLQLHYIEVRSSDDFESAFSKITNTVRATALFLQPVGLFFDSTKTNRGLGSKKPVARDLRFEGTYGGRSSHVLRSGPCRLGAAHRYLRGQDFSRAPNPPTCPSSSPPNSTWSSTSRPRRRSASTCLCSSGSAPTR